MDVPCVFITSSAPLQRHVQRPGAAPRPRYARAMCGRVCLDATARVIIITFYGCATANYFGRVGKLFTGNVAENDIGLCQVSGRMVNGLVRPRLKNSK